MTGSENTGDVIVENTWCDGSLRRRRSTQEETCRDRGTLSPDILNLGDGENEILFTVSLGPYTVPRLINYRASIASIRGVFRVSAHASNRSAQFTNSRRSK